MKLITKHLIALCAIVVTFSLLASWFPNLGTGIHTALADSYPQVSATELHNIFQDNEVAANKKYKGKVIEVKGTVYKVDTGWLGTYVYLDVGLFSEIHCEMASGQEDILASLWKGQTVVIRGRCTGKTLGSVFLDNCKVTKKQKSK